MNAVHAMRCLMGILTREALRFVHQRERFIAALVRPLLWLLIVGAGFRTAFGDTVVAPYAEAVRYEVYIVPGLIAMIQLFNGMQSSLSMVYDREMGSMRTLLVSPLPRWYLLTCKLMAGTFVSLLQVYAFLIVARLTGVELPPIGFLLVLPALIVNGLMLGAFGMLLSSVVRQLENFAGFMNFVLFPVCFLSPALYPLARLRDSSEILYRLCTLNPFTYAVDLVRFAIYGQLNLPAAAVTLAALAAFLALAVYAYDSARGMMARRHVGEP